MLTETITGYSWGPGTITYVMFVNQANTVEFWWRDTDTSLASTSAHPINVWTKSYGAAAIKVDPASSLGYTNYFYAQAADTDLIEGYNVSWAAENTSLVGLAFAVGSEPGLAGTHLSVSALPNPDGGNDVVVFYQTNGSDISEFTRDLVAGQWTGLEIPIPNQ